MPSRDAAIPIAAATVVFPTPPFPATISMRDAVKKSEGSIPMTRVLGSMWRTLALGVVLVLGPLALKCGRPVRRSARPAVEQAGFVEVLEVSGLLDDVAADALENAIRAANVDRARSLVLQLNSKQAVISDERLNELAQLISESAVPINVWVGPSGSRAAGKVAQLIDVADSIGVAIGARLGPTGDQALDATRFGQVYGDNQQLLADTDLTWEQAIDVGIVPCDLVEVDELGTALTPDESLARCANPTVGDFLVGLDTFDSRVVDTEAGPRLEPLTRVRFRGLSLLDQLMHTVASPPVAYLMLVIGMALLLFEFYSIGIGIAGVLGATFLASWRLRARCPTHPHVGARCPGVVDGGVRHRHPECRTAGVDRDWHGAVRGGDGLVVPRGRCLDVVDTNGGSHRRDWHRDVPGHAHHGSWPVLHHRNPTRVPRR